MEAAVSSRRGRVFGLLFVCWWWAGMLAPPGVHQPPGGAVTCG